MEAIAIRYALALEKIALESKQPGVYLTTLENLAQVLDSDPQLIKFLQNEFYTSKNKIDFINRVFNEEQWLNIASVLKIFLHNRRIPYLHASVREAILSLQTILEKQQGIVYSVYPISNDHLQQLSKSLAHQLGHPVFLSQLIEPKLLGGIRIEVGGKVFDASFLQQLSILKNRLLKKGVSL
jgi:F-type H+-transporting ATPase subunit delta